MERRIVALTGSRGEWGYIRPVLEAIQGDSLLNYHLVVTNMHLLPEFGMTIHEIERDGFLIADRIYMTFDGYTGVTMAKSLGSLLLELPSVLHRLRPDVLLLAGDRGEQMIGALAAVHLGIPVAHIQAGELSGNVDGVVRHAITKLAHIHFAANEEFAERVRKLGEDEARVFVTGAPLVDDLTNEYVTPVVDLKERYGVSFDDPFALAVQHPVTEEEADAAGQISETLKALADLDLPTVLIYPNSDAGSDVIRQVLRALKTPRIHHFRSLPRADYLGLLRKASVLVGNSSSALLEAPTFGTPAVNIGTRQKGRMRAGNVIDVAHHSTDISQGIKVALSDEFQRSSRLVVNPYGDGKAAERIVGILREIEIGPELLTKTMTY
jgi:UDP-hydrolysing UDP-N-acetyl-D-glucosamine 2-epimerase